MLTSKQRAYLRALANKEPTVLQIGKDGVSDALLRQVEQTVESRELIKIRVLETAGLTARQACEEICRRTGCEPVQCIGSRLVVYRPSRENPAIVLPR